MQQIVDLYRNLVIQIATPYSTGTGIYLQQADLIVTNEHIVRDNQSVVIVGQQMVKQMAPVIYLDSQYDLAFIKAPPVPDMPAARLRTQAAATGEVVLAIGHPFEAAFATARGTIGNTHYQRGTTSYLQHDAVLHPANSGGPLIDQQGAIIGINTFIPQEAQPLAFSLPLSQVLETLQHFQHKTPHTGVRCDSCANIVASQEAPEQRCPHCAYPIVFPHQIPPYEPIGVAKTIEAMLARNGYQVPISRKGPSAWTIQKGSAKINISYYEKAGLITGDAYLCKLPQHNTSAIYEYLLRQNDQLEGLTFSIQGQDIILSLLIYDHYLNIETGMPLLENLFQMADHYDNILVENYGAQWNYTA